MKKLPIYLSLLLLLTCAKEDSQAPNNPPSQVIKQYTLSVTAGDGGSVSTTGGTFSQGSQLSITATPNAGYSFSGWSNGSTANPLSVTLNSNTSITANFEVLINSYTLTVVSTDGGNATGGGEYNEGTEVTLTATASDGYRFTGWSDGSTEETITITLNSDTALTANFEVINFTTKSERYSDINETTSYFKNQEYFTGYLSKQFIIDQLNIFSDDHSQYWVFGKNIAILDFDDDQKQDIIAFGSSFCQDHDYSTHNGIFIYVSDYINGGSITSFPSDSFYGLEMDVNDFNGDGISDVLFYPHDTKMNSYNWNEDSGGNTNNPPNSPTLLYYDKLSESLKSTNIGLAMDHHGASSGDLDNDGDIDFIQWPIPGRYSDQDTYLQPIVNYNQGSGIFIQQNLITDLDPYKWHATAYELFDINNDGFLDLVAGWRVGVPKWEVIDNYIENTLSGPVLFYGNGSGVFSRNSSYMLTETILSNQNIQAGLLGVSFTDYELDGDIDILLTTTREEPDGLDSDEGLYYNNYHLVLLKNDNGVFTDISNVIQEQWSNDIPNFYFIRTIDKNDDGRFDLVPDGFANWTPKQYGNDIHWLNINDTYLKNN